MELSEMRKRNRPMRRLVDAVMKGMQWVRKRVTTFCGRPYREQLKEEETTGQLTDLHHQHHERCVMGFVMVLSLWGWGGVAVLVLCTGLVLTSSESTDSQPGSLCCFPVLF